jgi:hypothetical protein
LWQTIAVGISTRKGTKPDAVHDMGNDGVFQSLQVPAPRRKHSGNRLSRSGVAHLLSSQGGSPPSMKARRNVAQSNESRSGCAACARRDCTHEEYDIVTTAVFVSSPHS